MNANGAGSAAERIMVALDYQEAGSALDVVRKLDGIPCWMKVGMELFYAEGPAFVRELKDRGHKVFLDLKLHDIPNTVRGAARSVTRLGADMFNVHAAGGSAMMRAAMEGVVQGAEGGALPQVIAVTQLTSTSQDMLNEEIGIAGSVADTVVRYAQLAKASGLQGVVASAQEAGILKEACGSGFVLVTPGIRPAGSSMDDQSRVLTPAQALAAGSDYLVIGRPITAASDPRAALESIVKELVHS
ncbi:orotidine-5'-phosphate decarboxylase [Paenibacillus turpanensis]|uniref:orotidine-5'-phosphate decarboxylase n=1 Tax=Paenibacillus turpanensis TaxID=2689078 RepID=UPI00140D1341|nr:orotidine-5'-phosphate decarboxylase [Paenibacillus turpanensis]